MREAELEMDFSI